MTGSSHVRWGCCFVSHTFQPDHRSLWKKGKALKILAGTERGKKRGCVFLFNFLLSSPFFSHLDRINSIVVLHRGGWMSRVETQRVNMHIPSFKIWSMLQGSPGVCNSHEWGVRVGSGGGFGFEPRLNSSSVTRQIISCLHHCLCKRE